MNGNGTGDVKTTLAERELQHGPFANHAVIEIQLSNIVNRHATTAMSPTKKIALQMIMHKIARILNQGYNHSDTWHDIAGYALLAEREILDE